MSRLPNPGGPFGPPMEGTVRPHVSPWPRAAGFGFGWFWGGQYICTPGPAAVLFVLDHIHSPVGSAA
ncbi:uncharacterized protein EHS24_004492 [Apiotrichum porosum]|uniref:Uncharacterized protein n=1 Tax=Apiotrichum porosum TaxID=105984 RepID=A0A427Y596_9TREE|nr:uncharacterized protein EHS24_004492 [Apiotrichum porosum]RSH86254.1 hypothetical protein EHS24_004492 [Apiotrichum porosum]